MLDVVSQHEAGITLAVGCCGLLGGSGFPLWSDEGEVQSGLNGDYKKIKTYHPFITLKSDTGAFTSLETTY